MSNYTGIIIEESLESKDVLTKLKIVKTVVEKVTKSHKTPHISQWTMHTVEISETDVDSIMEELSKSLDTAHNNWYCDFRNDKLHYIVFSSKIFKVNKANPEEYMQVKEYGRSIGIPEYQLDFDKN